MIIVVSYWWMKWVASAAYRIAGSEKVYSAMSLGFLIILREAGLRDDEVLIRHETIHWRQQREMLVVGHWIVYLGFYFYYLAVFRDHEKAYRRNPFEREAYQFDADTDYLRRRPMFAWRKFL